MKQLSGWVALAACGIGTMGCADLGVTSASLSPIPQRPLHAEECNPSVPCVATRADIPAEWAPKIYSVHPVVYWSGDRAVGSSTMSYYGNRAEETFELKISGLSEASRTAGATSNGSSIFPTNNTHTTPGFPLTAPKGSCGHLADLSSRHFATTTIWVSWEGFDGNTVSRSGGHSSRQPECSCGGGGSGPGDDPPILSVGPTFTPSANCTGGGGGDTGGTTYRCYMVRLDYYWYYPDTDTYEYRYSEEYSYCEETS